MTSWTGQLTLIMSPKKQVVFPKETGILQCLQKNAADVLPVSRFPALSSVSVLGAQRQTEGHTEAGQAHQGGAQWLRM